MLDAAARSYFALDVEEGVDLIELPAALLLHRLSLSSVVLSSNRSRASPCDLGSGYVIEQRGMVILVTEGDP